jgi:prophage regulatory protein
MTDKLLRLPDVEARTGLRRSHIYGLAAKGRFPAPLKLGDRASAWVESEVRDWVTARIRASGRSVPPASPEGSR